MRSFFKKPSWASRGDTGADSEFYRRADQTYKDIIAATKIARERLPGPTESNPHKRRRTSDETLHRDNFRGEVGGDRQPTLDQNDLHEPANPPLSISQDTSSRPHLTRNVSKPDHSRYANMTHSVSSEPHLSLDGHVHLTNLQPLESLPMTEASLKEDAPRKSCRQSSGIQTERVTPTLHQESTHDNVVVQILITSRISNTKPLIVHRKISQPLKDVRLAWCDRQNLPKEIHSSVFLTWKGRRLFDVTTCKSLKIDGQRSHGSRLETYSYFDGDTDGIRIHMEAVTNDLLSLNQQPRSNNGIDLASTSIDSSEKAQQASNSVVLKCPGYADFKMKVGFDMQVLQVITAFRDARNVPQNRGVYLVFDGDRLDPRFSLAKYDIADEDLLDVIIKERK